MFFAYAAARGLHETSRQEAARQWLADYIEHEKDPNLMSGMLKRAEEEKQTHHGSQIWFSRYLKHGRFKHWVLAINDNKYELYQAEDGSIQHRIEKWHFDQGLREATMIVTGTPEVSEFYVCLIGWTKYPDVKLQKIADEVFADFGEYKRFANNCQHYLQEFAKKIVSKKALDWSWFAEHKKTDYQYAQKFPEPPREIKSYQEYETNRRIALQQDIALEQRREEAAKKIWEDYNGIYERNIGRPEPERVSLALKAMRKRQEVEIDHLMDKQTKEIKANERDAERRFFAQYGYSARAAALMPP